MIMFDGKRFSAYIVSPIGPVHHSSRHLFISLSNNIYAQRAENDKKYNCTFHTAHDLSNLFFKIFVLNISSFKVRLGKNYRELLQL